jgi:hypothetical protein
VIIFEYDDFYHYAKHESLVEAVRISGELVHEMPHRDISGGDSWE